MIMTDNKGIKKNAKRVNLCIRMVAKHVLNELKLYWHQSGHWQSDPRGAQEFPSLAAAAPKLTLAREMTNWVHEVNLEVIQAA